MLAVTPFDAQAATADHRGPSNDPSTLVQNSGGAWTRTYPNGTVVQFNSSGQETSEADRNGNTTSCSPRHQRRRRQALQTITDPVGLVTTLAYDSSSHLSTITDPADRVTTITVDSNDNLTNITDPDDALTQYGYSTPANHLITTETDPNDNTATAYYNSYDQFTSETLFDGSSTTEVSAAQSNAPLDPGGYGQLPIAYQASVTDPDGNTTTVTYNAQSHPIGVTDPATGETASSTVYSAQGFTVTETDKNGNTIPTRQPGGSVTSITQFDNGDGSSEQQHDRDDRLWDSTRSRHRSPTSTATRPPTRSIRTATS